MQHDTYSLGVVLLEIGLWLSFVEYEANKATPLIRYQILGIRPDATPRGDLEKVCRVESESGAGEQNECGVCERGVELFDVSGSR